MAGRIDGPIQSHGLEIGFAYGLALLLICAAGFSASVLIIGLRFPFMPEFQASMWKIVKAIGFGISLTGGFLFMLYQHLRDIELIHSGGITQPERSRMRRAWIWFRQMSPVSLARLASQWRKRCRERKSLLQVLPTAVLAYLWLFIACLLFICPVMVFVPSWFFLQAALQPTITMAQRVTLGLAATMPLASVIILTPWVFRRIHDIYSSSIIIPFDSKTV